MKQTNLLAIGTFAALLTACAGTIQTSSGADYLSRYDGSYQTTDGKGSDIDADVRRIAAIEPDIRFPARIGLARIAHGYLVDVPADEGYIWQDLAMGLEQDYGEFVPVSPLIAGMVAEPFDNSQFVTRNRTANVIAEIRRGAARQHLDYVLVYEVGSSRQDKSNILSLADLTIIGLFVLPSRSVEIEASASGILIDVRNGYPYATVTAHAEKGGIARAAYSSDKAIALADTAEDIAVLNLAAEVGEAMTLLAEEASSDE